MPRTVTLTVDPETDGRADTATQNGIGYLVCWAQHSERYTALRLYVDKQLDLHAQYYNAAGDPTYTMFGMRDKDGTYSFHS